MTPTNLQQPAFASGGGGESTVSLSSMGFEDSTQRALELIEQAKVQTPVDDDAEVSLSTDYVALKFGLIAASIFGIFYWQWSMPITAWTMQDVLQALYYIPCLLAAVMFGFRGAVAASMLSAGLTIFHVYTAMGGDFFGACLCRTFHVLLLLTVSFGAGWLFERSAMARLRAEHSAGQLNEASGLLMETSNRLADSLRKLRNATLTNKRTEEQLRRAERLNALGKLTAGLAHEIRNPLASIHGSAEILTDRAERDPTLKEFVTIIQQETTRLEEVLSRFLDFAQSKKTENEHSKPNDVIQEVISLITPQIKRSQIQLTTNIPKQLPAVDIAPIHLRQVLLNLVLNASQALAQDAGDGKNIHIGVFPPNSDDETPAVRIIVADSGPGIPEDNKQSIFDPFFTTKDEGTGLGLAIIDRIIRDANGQIMLLEDEDLPSPYLQHYSGARFMIELAIHDSRQP
jgi:signal transduction histidine kinase